MKTDNIHNLPPAYRHFYRSIAPKLPPSRIITDPLRCLAYGTDASFYRLIPKMVIRAAGEAEVASILAAAAREEIAVTFRAAGTSLSGQAVTDSVLLLAGDDWKQYDILENGRQIRLQPGIVGGKANQYLAPFGRKIGPDPASINAAMIGGIAANNASGMCCGTAENSYKTVASMRIIFRDGTLLDTADPKSRDAFRRTHTEMLDKLEQLGRRVRDDNRLAGLIRRKFKIKNTTGYSLNALVDFEGEQARHAGVP